MAVFLVRLKYVITSYYQPNVVDQRRIRNVEKCIFYSVLQRWGQIS